MTQADLPRKVAPQRSQRLWRLVRSTLDPRAWLHLIKLVNYYNYSHVQPLRAITFAGEANVSPDAVFAHGERVFLGKRVRIGSRCHLWAGPAHGRITLGDDVLIGPDVLITAASYQYNSGTPVTDQPMAEADVTIGKDVWLATRVVVLPGASIGDGAIIAAGSVVKGSIPPMAIAAGSPAKVVSRRVLPGNSGRQLPRGS